MKKIFSSKIKILLIIEAVKANNIVKIRLGVDWKIIIKFVFLKLPEANYHQKNITIMLKKQKVNPKDTSIILIKSKNKKSHIFKVYICTKKTS